jgi:hypothetical protein
MEPYHGLDKKTFTACPPRGAMENRATKEAARKRAQKELATAREMLAGARRLHRASMPAHRLAQRAEKSLSRGVKQTKRAASPSSASSARSHRNRAQICLSPLAFIQRISVRGF